jgi:hypothetical protein
MREGFTVIESLLNEQIKSVEAGNQHACCIVDRADPLQEALKEMRAMNETGVRPSSS